MDQVTSCDYWPSDLDTCEVTPLDDDPVLHIIRQPEGSCGASRPVRGESETSPFGSWDYEPQHSSSTGLLQSLDQALPPFQLQQTPSNLSSEWHGAYYSSSSDYHLGGNFTMPETEPSNLPPMSNFGNMGWRSHSDSFHLQSTDSNYEEFQKSQPPIMRLEKTATESYLPRSLTAFLSSREPNEANDNMSLKQVFPKQTPLPSDDEQIIFREQQNVNDEYSHLQSLSDQFWVQPQFSKTSGNPHSVFTDHNGCDSLNFVSSSLQATKLSNTIGLQEGFQYGNQEDPCENSLPAYESTLSPGKKIFESGRGYSFRWSITLPDTSDSEVPFRRGTPKRPQKHRDRLPKEEYEKMSQEDMEARRKYLNNICAQEYRQRIKMELMESKRKYLAEKQRKQRMQSEIESLEAQIAVLEESFHRLSSS